MGKGGRQIGQKVPVIFIQSIVIAQNDGLVVKRSKSSTWGSLHIHKMCVDLVRSLDMTSFFVTQGKKKKTPEGDSRCLLTGQLGARPNW